MKRFSISIINQKGGVGKTTSTINIASMLAICNAKVLVIDLDPQGNSSDTLLPNIDINNCRSTYHLFHDQLKKQDYPFDAYIQTASFDKHDTTVDVIPANIKLAEIEIELTNEISREKVMSRFFRKFESELNHYDFIIIDCPPSLGLLTINSFVASDYLLVPVDASAYSHQGLTELVESLGKCNQIFDCGTELIGIFFAKYVERESVYKESYRFLKENAKGRLFETVIRKSTQIEQAPHFNKTIIDYAPDSRAFEDYRLLTSELVRRLNNEEIHTSERRQQTVSN